MRPMGLRTDRGVLHQDAAVKTEAIMRAVLAFEDEVPAASAV